LQENPLRNIFSFNRELQVTRALTQKLAFSLVQVPDEFALEHVAWDAEHEALSLKHNNASDFLFASLTSPFLTY
jgi:hypothetical protein